MNLQQFEDLLMDHTLLHINNPRLIILDYDNYNELYFCVPNDIMQVEQFGEFILMGISIQCSDCNLVELRDSDLGYTIRDEFLCQKTIKIIDEQHKCNCPIQLLLTRGCQCGGI